MAGEPASNEIAAALDELVGSATRTPAWVERYRSLAALLIADHPEVDGTGHLIVLSMLADSSPQVVGVDDHLTLTRAEWTKDSLLLTLCFSAPDPSKRTMFRIEGAEPRVWYVTGIEGASCEFTQRSVNVWLPCVDGDLEFTTGSY